MFGKKAYLRTLESRKKALLAESEVNRIELLNEWETLKMEANHIKRQLRAAGSIASSAAVLATVTSLLRRRHAEPPKPEHHAKPSWLGAAINGAQTGASLFFKVRSLLRQRR